MDTRKLRHVVALSNAGSYAGAAERLGLTQPALTRSIQALETELGLKLFDRDRQGARPTRAGASLVVEAETILRQLDRLQHDMDLLADRRAGHVDLGIGPLPATLALSTVLARIARDHRGLVVRTRIDAAPQLLDMLRSGTIELAAMAYPFVAQAADDLSIQRLGTLTIGALVRAGHPLAGQAGTDEALQPYPIIGGLGGGLPAPAWRYGPDLACENFDILRRVTLDSDAVWVTATCMAGDGLEVLARTVPAGPLPIVLVSLARRALSPGATLCRDLLRDAMAGVAADHARRGSA